MRYFSGAVCCISLALLAASSSHAAAQQGNAAPKALQTDEEKIASAISAAPDSIGQNAAVVMFDQGQMRTLREGTNNFTCLPDNPKNPINDPLCVDENGLEWIKARIAKKEPPDGKIGFAYMLQGGTTANNADPSATEPPAGTHWHKEPPHIMILNTASTMQGYPRPGENPERTQPWVMYPDSPYEHLMLPVE
jgi:hypothetical protein